MRDISYAKTANVSPALTSAQTALFTTWPFRSSVWSSKLRLMILHAGREAVCPRCLVRSWGTILENAAEINGLTFRFCSKNIPLLRKASRFSAGEMNRSIDVSDLPHTQHNCGLLAIKPSTRIRTHLLVSIVSFQPEEATYEAEL